ncbi:hydroxyethylthiazole kinase [Adlercreutzia sp. ZJ138]|uniref:hydroxyethylthiazole kinase n=1 Tax=Adlercreutzia sp. ZJ138 TaxID=2709405 RepID=UPI0013EE2E7A|nr:hydroxyethylthiazole kinase [Adlercreutzia sp. ZJ138]
MNAEQLRKGIEEAVLAVRERRPLAGSVTNGVTTDFVANAQLAVGGSAAMVYLPDEGEALVAAGDAVYVNMGTLLPVHEQTIPAVVKAAHAAGKTCVLDPVGIGIGQLRTDILSALKPFKPRIVRGNASEIIALAGLWELEGDASELGRAHGVDTTDAVDAARGAACALARYTGGAVAVSGEVDLVTDGTTIVHVQGGSELMERVTGFGCSLGGVCAVYAAVTDPFTAALAATAHYNVVGLRAAATHAAPASFKQAFIDELYLIQPTDIAHCELTVE